MDVVRGCNPLGCLPHTILQSEKRLKTRQTFSFAGCFTDEMQKQAIPLKLYSTIDYGDIRTASQTIDGL